MGEPARKYPPPHLRAVESGQAAPGEIPFLEAVEAYLEHRDREAWITRDYSAARTIETYRYRLYALCRFVAGTRIAARREADLNAMSPKEARLLCDAEMEQITLADFAPDTIRDYLYIEARRGISARTRNARLYSFRPFFRWAAETYGDPKLDVSLDLAKSQVQPQKKRGVTSLHWTTLIEHLEERVESARHGWRDLVLFRTMRYFGRRVSEIVELNRDSVYRRRDCIVIEYVGKGNKHRSKRLPLYNETGKLAHVVRYEQELDHYLRVVLPRRYRPAEGHEKALFLTQKRQRITVRQVERIFQARLKAVGLDREEYTPHSLRHGFARAKLDAGVGLRKLQKLLDHASLRTTEEYLDADEEELTEAMGRGLEEA